MMNVILPAFAGRGCVPMTQDDATRADSAKPDWKAGAGEPRVARPGFPSATSFYSLHGYLQYFFTAIEAGVLTYGTLPCGSPSKYFSNRLSYVPSFLILARPSLLFFNSFGVLLVTGMP